MRKVERHDVAVAVWSRDPDWGGGERVQELVAEQW